MKNVLDNLHNTNSKNTDWIPCKVQIPEEKTNPITLDWYIYPVTIQVGKERDVRYYKFGNGHWWHGTECMDKYVIAWKNVTEPYTADENCDCIKN